VGPRCDTLSVVDFEYPLRDGGSRVLKRYGSTLTALCGLVLLAATGCTENPPASTLPPPSTTPTSTPSTTPSTPKPQPPIMPAAAKMKSRVGLQAFARHWLASIDYLKRTGDSKPFLALSRPSCEWCTGIAKPYVDVYKAGGHLQGDLESRLERFYLTGLSGANVGYVEFAVETSTHQEIPSPSSSPNPQRGASRDFTLNLVYAGGSWHVTTAKWTTVKEHD